VPIDGVVRTAAGPPRQGSNAIRRQTAPAVLLAVVVLLATACATDDEAGTAASSAPAVARPASPTPGDGSVPTPDADASAPAPAPAEAIAAPTVDATCQLAPDGGPTPTITLSYPSSWEVTDPDAPPCRFFDPDDPAIEADTENLAVAVRADVEPVAFRRVAEPGPAFDESSRLTTAVDGRRAVRVQGTTTGEGLGPAGDRRTTWLVDLGGDDAGVLRITAAERGADAYVRAVAVADRIARSAVIGDGDDAPGTTLARAAGGGMPFTVVYRAGCVRLFAGDAQGSALDEECGLRSDDLAAVALTDGDLRVVAGVTSDAVDLVRFGGDGDVAGGAATVPLANAAGRGFALAAPDGDLTLRAETFAGEQIATRVLSSP
jgi:hypothetical protein